MAAVASVSGPIPVANMSFDSKFVLRSSFWSFCCIALDLQKQHFQAIF